ncbi:MAG: winged helix-turn-helix transcriptional regulator [Proteobacteria bacterium]|nr:winged helix-turn-helix transcriptional regulator [Pseudomonadota bacterium]
MTPEAAAIFEQCNCLAVRQAARHLTQFYDQFLASSGLRTTQFSILAKLRGYGPLSINALAKELVMDRTTLGRNMLPLEREGLIEIASSATDRRTKELRLTEAGVERLRAAAPGWIDAQSRFEQAFGRKRSSALRALLGEVVASEM